VTSRLRRLPDPNRRHFAKYFGRRAASAHLVWWYHRPILGNYRCWEYFSPAQGELRVPRFYFHIVAAAVVLDENGAEFGDGKSALTHAKLMARDLQRNIDFAGGSVLVEDEESGELFEVPLAGLSS
jgi:hypothetical protein